MFKVRFHAIVIGFMGHNAPMVLDAAHVLILGRKRLLNVDAVPRGTGLNLAILHHGRNYEALKNQVNRVKIKRTHYLNPRMRPDKKRNAVTPRSPAMGDYGAQLWESSCGEQCPLLTKADIRNAFPQESTVERSWPWIWLIPSAGNAG